ncbi:hypothetical protein BJ322DRAFT_1035289 [Thelephora terrestris]|uniref:Uncharacterized protein n=1 Tax=Thelephora terrestris TaxID=56493 RepID=A0A9P6HSF9_9AGAM|nr:hypothetical protein BJ322DRAFT_1035289 [Thelephora terrestris]
MPTTAIDNLTPTHSCDCCWSSDVLTNTNEHGLYSDRTPKLHLAHACAQPALISGAQGLRVVELLGIKLPLISSTSLFHVIYSLVGENAKTRESSTKASLRQMPEARNHRGPYGPRRPNEPRGPSFHSSRLPVSNGSKPVPSRIVVMRVLGIPISAYSQ